jgi:flagellar biosynthesis protein FliR
VMFLPVFRGGMVPGMVKAALSLMIAFIVFPTIPREAVTIPGQLLPFAAVAIKEVMVGLVLGFAATLLFLPVQLAGRIIDLQTGFAAAETLDPSTEVETTLLAQLKVLVITLLFLLLDGHHFFIRAISDTFTVIPLGQVSLLQSGSIADHLSQLISATFTLSIKISAPVLVPLLISYFCLGIIARAMPQLNIFFVGMPLQIALGILTLVFFLPIMWSMFEKYFTGFQESYYTLFYLLR